MKKVIKNLLRSRLSDNLKFIFPQFIFYFSELMLKQFVQFMNNLAEYLRKQRKTSDYNRGLKKIVILHFDAISVYAIR